MRPSDCSKCERAVDRNARLILHVRRVASKLHVALHHRGTWADCREPQCQETADVVDGKPSIRVESTLSRKDS